MKRTLLITLLLGFVASLNAQNSPIRVEATGEGKPVVLLPGFTCPSAVWDSTIANVRGSYQFHRVAYAGFDGMPPVAMPWYPKLTQAIAHYIVSNNLSGVTIIGHSMGGNLAIDIAALLPQRVSSLVLVDAIPCMRELMMPGVPASSVQYDNPYNKQMLGMTDEAFEQMAASMAGTMTNQQEAVPMLIRWMKAADRETYVYGYTDLLKLDLRETLRLVGARTLILGAAFPSAERVTSVFEAQYANLATKRIAIAPEGCKHFVMLDAPQWFYGELNAFLQ